MNTSRRGKPRWAIRILCILTWTEYTVYSVYSYTKPSGAQPPPRSAGAPLLHLHHGLSLPLTDRCPRLTPTAPPTGSSGAGTNSSLASAAGATLAARRARSGLGFAAGGMAVHEPRRLGFSRGGGGVSICVFGCVFCVYSLVGWIHSVSCVSGPPNLCIAHLGINIKAGKAFLALTRPSRVGFSADAKSKRSRDAKKSRDRAGAQVGVVGRRGCRDEPRQPGDCKRRAWRRRRQFSVLPACRIRILWTLQMTREKIEGQVDRDGQE